MSSPDSGPDDVVAGNYDVLVGDHDTQAHGQRRRRGRRRRNQDLTNEDDDEDDAADQQGADNRHLDGDENRLDFARHRDQHLQDSELDGEADKHDQRNNSRRARNQRRHQQSHQHQTYINNNNNHHHYHHTQQHHNNNQQLQQQQYFEDTHVNLDHNHNSELEPLHKNEPTSELRAILTNFLDRFERLELDLGQPECCYTREFKMLKKLSGALKEDVSNFDIGQQVENLRKNRYKDILPFNHTRVILNDDPSVPGSCYINANYIRGASGSPNAYIACQGPLAYTLVDFWRMIWECNVSVVIMACNSNESGKSQCELYWPERVNERRVYGNLHITLIRVRQICDDFMVRKFSVKYVEKVRRKKNRNNNNNNNNNLSNKSNDGINANKKRHNLANNSGRGAGPMMSTFVPAHGPPLVNSNSNTSTTIPASNSAASMSTTTSDFQDSSNSTNRNNNNGAQPNGSKVTKSEPLGAAGKRPARQPKRHFFQQAAQHDRSHKTTTSTAAPPPSQPAPDLGTGSSKSEWNKHLTNGDNQHQQTPSTAPIYDSGDGLDLDEEVNEVTGERIVCQFHYTTWPDHGAPDTVQPVLELVQLVRDVQPTEDRPILVHCSAGCGRTGTICCIDYVMGLLKRGKLEHSFDLCRIISDMRRQRVAMVQTLSQYIFCHRAVAALFLKQLNLIEDHIYENLEPIDFDLNSAEADDDIGPVFI